MHLSRSNIFRLAILIFVAAFVVALASVPHTTASASSGTAITGWAWSDTTGWIDFNCSNDSSCGTSNYGLSVAADGTVSGYAWSDNIGWISANSSDTSGCPTSPCQAALSGGALSGWLKAIAADGNGWDGWISLSGSGYGPSVSHNVFSGYAWGSNVVGWVDFSLARTNFQQCTVSYSCSGNDIVKTDTSCNTSTLDTCVSPQFCSVGSSTCLNADPSYDEFGDHSGHLEAAPQIVPKGLPTTLFWNVSNVASCSVSGGGQTWSGTSSGNDGQATNGITQQTVYTLTCDAMPGATPTSFSEDVTVNVLPVFQER